MSRASIEFDFRKAKQQAGKLDDAAEQIRRIANNNFQDTLQSISVSWTGENSRQYLNKGVALKNQMIQTARKLNGIASEIRTAAQRIYSAEMAALRIAEEREFRSRNK